MSFIATIDEILEDARNGQPFILVDADDRENEGDLIIPAQFASPRQIAFMACEARGLICLAITGERARELELPPMTTNNNSGHGTAFTVSIEAREGVTTGISAHDRAHTIAVATDPTKAARDLVSPGHVFPLVARPGGVLVRAGHTEAAVDIARMAGLIPAGVICEIMNDDGTMARMPELTAFAEKHGLKLGTISDLIAYRRRTDNYVEMVAEAPFHSHYGGDFTLRVYRDTLDGAEHLALVKGSIRPDQETLVRVHQVDLTADMLGWSAAEPDYVAGAIRALAAHDGAAVGIFVQDPSPHSLADRVKGGRKDYHLRQGYRDYGVGAQILKHIGVCRMRLLTSSPAKLSAIEGFGLEVTSRQPMRTDPTKPATDAHADSP